MYELATRYAGFGLANSRPSVAAGSRSATRGSSHLPHPIRSGTRKNRDPLLEHPLR